MCVSHRCEAAAMVSVKDSRTSSGTGCIQNASGRSSAATTSSAENENSVLHEGWTRRVRSGVEDPEATLASERSPLRWPTYVCARASGERASSI